jgi:A/G-specific adenine glycosylase
VHIQIEKRTNTVAEARYVWTDLNKMADAALPAPVKKFLIALV